MKMSFASAIERSRLEIMTRTSQFGLSGPGMREAFIKTARKLFIGGFATSLWLFLITAPARAAELRVLSGHVPPVVARLQPVGRLPGTNRLALAIGLPLRNQETLTNLLQQIYDPSSTNYHHYLTSEQFTEAFGPTREDYQAVIAFAKANGLT